MKRLYLACPYSHDDKWIEFRRYHQVTVKAGKLMKLGYIVYSPISHSHNIALVTPDLPKDIAFWMKIDLPFIDWCDEVWVYMLPGWEESKGVQAELKYAQEIGKPRVFIK